MKHLILLLTLVFIFFKGSNVIAQCGSMTNVLGPDTVLCQGDSLTLTGAANAIGESWSNGSTENSITVGTSGTYIYSLTSINLVSNGDFSQGNTGFTSGYIYGTGGSWGLLSNPGQYAISTNANLTHNNFVNCTDHTSGTGNYLICNGASVANTNVWCQTVAIQPNTTYNISAWFTSVVGGSPGQLNFAINGVNLGLTFTLSNSTCSWTQYTQTWTSGAAQTSINFCIVSQSTAGGGNDFAFDDIVFEEMCPVSDTIQVDFNAYPIVDLGNDTVICTGNSLTIDATDSVFYSYLWSNGSTNPVQSISQTDSNLWIGVSNGNCTTFDTLAVTSASHPMVDLGANAIKCPGDTLVLDAFWPYSTYTWQNSSTDTTFNVIQTGTYWVEVTDNCGTASDTIVVDYVNFPLATLGTDTAICNGDTLTINANPNLDAYVWNTGANSQSINITSSGTYWVAATLDNCTDYDTIQVAVTPVPNVNLGNDTTLCQGENIILNATNSNATYLWNNGSTNPIYFVAFSGVYSVTASINNCSTTDSIQVDFIPLPTPNLGPDTSTCIGNTVVLNAGSPNATYTWQDNSTDSTFSVTSSGTYWVEATNICGTVAETILVNMVPVPVVNLGEDITFCEGTQINLNASSAGATYQWSTTETTSNIDVNTSGVYWVGVTKSNCTGYDTIEVTQIPLPTVHLGGDTTICSSDAITLDASYPNATYEWEDASTQEVRNVNQNGLYWVIVSVGNCATRDSVEITLMDCNVILEMPNIFTPNNDGQNDVFTPITISGVSQGVLTIFNRWGKEVFKTTNPKMEWDGKDDSENVATDGVYFWTATVIGLDGTEYSYQGNVTIQK